MKGASLLNGIDNYTPSLTASNRKKALKKECNLMCLTAVAPQLAVTVVTVALTVIFALLNNYDELIESISGLEFQVLFSFFVFVPPFLLATRLSRGSFSGIFPLRPVRLGLLLPILGVALCGTIFLNFLLEPYIWLINSLGLSTDYGDFQIPEGISGGLLYIFTVAVVPALVEEFAFRGVVMSHFRRFGNTFAILASSVLFGLMHGNLVQIPFAFAAGCIMAYIDIITDSLLPSIILHFLNNLISAIGGLGEQYLDFAGNNWLYFGIFLACFVVGIASVVCLAKKYKYAFRSAGRGIMSTNEAMKCFVTTAGFWVSVVFFGGEALVLAFFG